MAPLRMSVSSPGIGITHSKVAELFVLTRCTTFTFVFTIRKVGSLCSYTLITVWLNMEKHKGRPTV